MHANIDGRFFDDAVDAKGVGEALVLGVVHCELNPHFLRSACFDRPPLVTAGGLVKTFTEHSDRHPGLNQAIQDP